MFKAVIVQPCCLVENDLKLVTDFLKLSSLRSKVILLSQNIFKIFEKKTVQLKLKIKIVLEAYELLGYSYS